MYVTDISLLHKVNALRWWYLTGSTTTEHINMHIIRSIACMSLDEGRGLDV